MQLRALLVIPILCVTIASAQEVGSYQTATTPLNGSERLLADQNGTTVNVTSAQTGCQVNSITVT